MLYARHLIPALVVLALGVACGSTSDSATSSTTALASTTSTAPAIDLSEIATSFNEECRAASSEADPGEIYMLGSLAEADATSIAFDLNARSTRFCAGMIGDLLQERFQFSQSTMSRLESTRALDGELDATSTDGKWHAFWRYHPDNGLDLTIEPGN